MERTAGFKPGQIVVALAGRENGNRYVVVGMDADRLLIADGIKRTVGRPKRKNPRHVKAIGSADGHPGGIWTDERVRQALRAMEEG